MLPRGASVGGAPASTLVSHDKLLLDHPASRRQSPSSCFACLSLWHGTALHWAVLVQSIGITSCYHERSESVGARSEVGLWPSVCMWIFFTAIAAVAASGAQGYHHPFVPLLFPPSISIFSLIFGGLFALISPLPSLWSPAFFRT
ncbi:hypothetical protein M758_5G002100 [Ceratodon purpureus]|uniref:Uncharacterized protein n=1 Tax=Ceratodon purpureus TaxID=3225 RepID=A0A8T0HXM3_CERPU|nr:hypothetical protein KC19_5G001800 [Ceratodon purpureus]KAG0614937.1 hypothetical protein M758_5G002100 [Ceratodon purpureus]